MAQGTDVLKVSDKAQSAFIEYIKACVGMRDEGGQDHGRWEEMDRAYQREADSTEEQRKARLANRGGNVNKLQNLTVPMVMESVENSVAFLTNVFLLDYPIYKFGADPEKEDLALQWNTLVGEDQIYYGWTGQLNIAFRNGEKYNFAPIEVEWCRSKKFIPKNGKGNNGVVLEEVIYEGNRIKALDPYNMIYDKRVKIYEVHTKGEFAGYIERMSRIALKIFIHNLGNDRLKNDKLAYESPDWDVSYYVPNINPSVLNKENKQDSFDWMRWAQDKAQGHIEYKNMYTVVTLYARIMPSEFSVAAPKDQTPDIWKLIAVNGVLVWAAPVPNAHDILPVIIVQPFVDNLDNQTKSSAENQLPFQEMVSALWNAKLQSARRRVTDRMLYNPLLVEPDHINSPNPSAKIPVRPTAYGRKLEEAIYQIPFEDGNSQYFVQEANSIAEWGMRANGQNRVSVGQFQKGNKLQSEFDTVMENSGSRERTKAIMWENYGMHPIKSILKSNYKQFAPAGKKYNRQEQTYVDVDPIALREAVAEFEVGDGLLKIQRLMNTEQMTPLFQTLHTVPGLAQQYETAPMFSYLAKMTGVDKLSKFEKKPEKIQYEQALASWQSIASLAVPELIKQMKQPEEVTKYIGPMPQPPQESQPTEKGKPNAGTPPR